MQAEARGSADTIYRMTHIDTLQGRALLMTSQK